MYTLKKREGGTILMQFNLKPCRPRESNPRPPGVLAMFKDSKILNISRSTISKWINNYNDKPTNLISVINKTDKTIILIFFIQILSVLKDEIIEIVVEILFLYL